MNEFKRKNRSELERRSIEALAAVQGGMTQDRVMSVQKFIDVDEYQLAIEVLFGVLIESKHPLSPMQYRLLMDTADYMEIDNRFSTELVNLVRTNC